MSERKVGDFARRHWKAELITSAALVAGAAAVVGGRAIRNKRRNRTEDEALISDMSEADMRTVLEALTDPTITPKTRELRLNISARVYLATHKSETHVLTTAALLERIKVDRPTLDEALGYLEESKLIAQRPSSIDPEQIGYFAEKPLSWAIADADPDSLPELQQAVHAVMYGAMID